jgi:hypothetical protein
MPSSKRATKEVVRDWLDERSRSDDPPPSRDEIRRQMGWDMIPENKRPDQVDDD